MQIIDTDIKDVKILEPKKFGDHRGFFSETYNQKVLEDLGIKGNFCQDNHSFSADKNTVRGLHFQTPPFAQGKLIRVTKGAIFDVAVDIRKGSPTFGKHVTAEIAADNWRQIWVPEGFAHGLCTLTPDTEVLYKVTGFYSPDHDKGLLWSDKNIGIKWPVKQDEAILSEKDLAQPLFETFDSPFIYGDMIEKAA